MVTIVVIDLNDPTTKVHYQSTSNKVLASVAAKNGKLVVFKPSVLI
jgi:ribose 5-phosphate isomerase RpiB